MQPITADPTAQAVPELNMLVDDAELSAAARSWRRSQQRTEQPSDLPSGTDDDLSPEERAYVVGMTSALRQIGTPSFLIDFMRATWSRVLLGEASSPTGRVDHMTGIGVNLVMSTQPKVTAAQREALERTMPALIAGLEQGMRKMNVSDDDRRTFFGRLMPAQAEALRGGALAGVIATPESTSVAMALSKILNPHLYGVGNVALAA